MNKLIPLLAFSILLLVPINVNHAFATHPACPGGILNTDPTFTAGGTSNFCFSVPTFLPVCPQGYLKVDVLISGIPAGPGPPCVFVPSNTQLDVCQNGAKLVGDHCVPDLNQICSTGAMIEPTQMLTCIAQAAGSMIGGALLEINTVSLLIGSIGVNPVITSLVGITLAGVAGQAVWFVHRRKKSRV